MKASLGKKDPVKFALSGFYCCRVRRGAETFLTRTGQIFTAD